MQYRTKRAQSLYYSYACIIVLRETERGLYLDLKFRLRFKNRNPAGKVQRRVFEM